MNLFSELERRVPPNLWRVIKEAGALADKKKQRAAVVGGVVRDVLLERPVVDADLMFEPPAEDLVRELGERHNAKIVSHEPFLTFTLHFPAGEKMDIVTAREERYPAPAHLPSVVPSTIPNDLKRRDFTINAIACSVNAADAGELIDPMGGAKDLESKRVRALHAQSFTDDPTRIYRAARFAARFGFRIEPETEKWIKESIRAKMPALLTPVRRRHEFELILKEESPLPALELLEKWEALRFLHPDWTLKKGSGPIFKQEESACLKMGPDPFSGTGRLIERLTVWFRPWGKAAAEKMMGELAFEREIKKKVLAAL